MFIRFKYVLLASMLALLTVSLSKPAVAQLVLYDNFASTNIDPSKWIGWQFYDPDIREAVRHLGGEEDNRHLHVSFTAYSATTDDSGGSGGPFSLAFPNPNAIKEVSFTAVVNRAETVGCISNPSSLIVTGVEFRGIFFNTESAPTSQIGDVTGVISISRSPSDVAGLLTVAGFYTRCNDQFCGNQTPLDYRVLGSVQPGAASQLHIKWDQPNHRFIFQLNGTTVVSPYTVSDSSPAVLPFRSIGLSRVVPHCTTTPRPFASIDAVVSNVFVNP